MMSVMGQGRTNSVENFDLVGPMNIVDYSNTPNLRDKGRSWVLEKMNHIDADPVL
jgi:hypothetical protein